MAMKARYTVLDGEVIAEKRSGVRRLYVPAPLGSTVALLDSTQAQTDTFSYWPYGEERTRTGTTQTPFRFVGTAGYYHDSAARTYVRARHLGVGRGRWLSVDPIWPVAAPYLYGAASPVVFVDPDGHACRRPHPCSSFDTTPCQYALDHRDDVRNGKHDLGGLICCEGRLYVCVWYKTKNTCITRCIKAHENDHIQGVPPCAPGDYGRPPFFEGRDPHLEECDAYKVGLKCILDCCPKQTGAARKECMKILCAMCADGGRECKDAKASFPYQQQCARYCRGDKPR